MVAENTVHRFSRSRDMKNKKDCRNGFLQTDKGKGRKV